MKTRKLPRTTEGSVRRRTLEFGVAPPLEQSVELDVENETLPGEEKNDENISSSQTEQGIIEEGSVRKRAKGKV